MALLKAEVEKQVTALLGPTTEADIAAAAAPKQKVHFHNPLSLVSYSLWAAFVVQHGLTLYNGLFCGLTT